MNKILNAAGSIATIVSLGIGLAGGYTISQYQVQSQNIAQSQQVKIVLQEVISDLPQEKRTFAQEIVESVNGVIEATGRSDSEALNAARDFRQHIAEASLLSYGVQSSPFHLTMHRTVTLCDGAFSVAYQLDNANGSQRFLVNGEIDSGVPGVVFEANHESRHLRLTYMEYLEKEKMAIMDYECG